MKHLYLFLLYFGLSYVVQAKTNVDSLSFESQRERVNALLEERTQKFGEYDESLKERTGIFGLFHSKSDMQKSIDILKAIVMNDNNIFVETKKLLDLKDSQKEYFEKLSAEYDQQVLAYIKTVSKLQKENDRLRLEIEELENTDHDNDVLIYIFILVIILLIAGNILFFFRYRALKEQSRKV